MVLQLEEQTVCVHAYTNVRLCVSNVSWERAFVLARATLVEA